MYDISRHTHLPCCYSWYRLTHIDVEWCLHTMLPIIPSHPTRSAQTSVTCIAFIVMLRPLPALTPTCPSKKHTPCWTIALHRLSFPVNMIMDGYECMDITWARPSPCRILCPQFVVAPLVVRVGGQSGSLHLHCPVWIMRRGAMVCAVYDCVIVLLRGILIVYNTLVLPCNYISFIHF